MSTPRPTEQDPRTVYQERRAARRTAHAAAERRHHAIGTVRLVLVGIAAALGIGVVGGAGYSAWWILAPLAGVVLARVSPRPDRDRAQPAGTGHRLLRPRPRAAGRRVGRHRRTGGRVRRPAAPVRGRPRSVRRRVPVPAPLRRADAPWHGDARRLAALPRRARCRPRPAGGDRRAHAQPRPAGGSGRAGRRHPRRRRCTSAVGLGPPRRPLSIRPRS